MGVSWPTCVWTFTRQPEGIALPDVNVGTDSGRAVAGEIDQVLFQPDQSSSCISRSTANATLSRTADRDLERKPATDREDSCCFAFGSGGELRKRDAVNAPNPTR
jgi:hypothetical protein